MPLILCIETSGRNCSVAVTDIRSVLACREASSDQYTHAENLHVFIEDVLKDAGITPSQLDAVGVSKGPGSYTGLRIGVSSAKGLCMALGVPLIAYPVTEIIAGQLFHDFPDARFAVPMIDARRMEVYTACYDRSLTLTEDIHARVLDEEFFVRLGEGVVFGGDGAMKAAHWKQANQEFVALEPSASFAVSAVEKAWNSQRFDDVAYFEPFYLKEFIAGKKSDAITQGNS
jgi:tRNA threonylcarbamoyladenosine biosynthesis protein TsaB